MALSEREHEEQQKDFAQDKETVRSRGLLILKHWRLTKVGSQDYMAGS